MQQLKSFKILVSVTSADCDVCATGAWLGLARYTFCLRPRPHELRDGRLLTITYCAIAVKTVSKFKKINLKYYLCMYDMLTVLDGDGTL